MSGSDLFTGTLELLILRVVQSDKLHGYAIGKRIRETSLGALEVEEGALYPALHRLQKKGHLTSEWGRTDTGRRAKFYALTGSGTQVLSEESKRWAAYAEGVSNVLSTADGQT